MEQSIKEILQTIDDAINRFQEKIPGIQKIMFDELQPLLKELQVQNGKLLNNVENLKLLGSIKNKLEKIIISREYKEAVKKFVASYDTLSALNMNYFAQFNQKFMPSKTLPIIKQLAIENTITDLVGQGMSETITGGVRDILNTNITTGGSYASLQDQLRDHMLYTDTGDGSLVKYTKQISTDAVNQFHAQYHEAIAQDLQFNWGRYVGSLIKTSREFCILLTAKEWVHKSELPEVIKGHIDGHKCKLSKTTGLPLGMIPGTDASNFKIRRGGYQCGHHWFTVPDSAVPENVKKKFANPDEPAPAPEKQNNSDKIIEANKSDVEKIEKDELTIYKDLLDALPGGLKIRKSNKKEAYYLPSKNEMVIGNFNRKTTKTLPRNASEYFRETLVAHETGHAIHSQKKVIETAASIYAKATVRKDFADHFAELQKIITGKEMQISNDLKRKPGASQNDGEQLAVMNDILGSLTRGRYGWGHPPKYYRTSGMPEAEIFAHSVSLLKVKNDFEDVNPDMKKVIEKMKEKISEWL